MSFQTTIINSQRMEENKQSQKFTIKALYKFVILLLTLQRNFQQPMKDSQTNRPILLTSAELRRRYTVSPAASSCHEKDNYILLVTSKGVSINPKIFLAVFRLKNGLPYLGMATKELICENEILIRVPESIILSTVKALHEPELASVFKDNFFLNEQPQDWEDRVLTVYCLFLQSRSSRSTEIWEMLVKQFQQSSDLARFWPEQIINKVKDETLRSACLRKSLDFAREWNSFQECRKRHKVLQSSIYDLENYKKVYANIQNRSFQKYIPNYRNSLAPFAEFINHHSSRVYYKTEEQKKTSFTEEDANDDESSIGSYDSADYIEEGEFDYQPESGNVEEKASQLDEQISKERWRMQQKLNWNDFTIALILKLWRNLEELKEISSTDQSLTDIKSISEVIGPYVELASHYYQNKKNKSYITHSQGSTQPIKQIAYPELTKDYESLVLVSTKSDRFEPNNQVFFRYGRNSNRNLLLDYGFCIEGNKYEHVWISFDLTEEMRASQGLMKVLQQKKASLHQKFKLYHHILNMDIIIFLRLKAWSRDSPIIDVFRPKDVAQQIVILQELIKLYQAKLLQYEDLTDLTESTLSYYQYFVAVYHQEKCLILQKQILMLEKLIQIHELTASGMNKQEVLLSLTKSEYTILKYYLQTLEVQ